MTCTFKLKYYNVNTRKKETFECDLKPVENKELCLFHDETYLKDIKYPENKDNVITKLRSMIDDSISKNTPLLCIGYYLPDIKEICQTFNYPIYFSYSTFYGTVDFSETYFQKDISFDNAVFEGEVSFRGCNFFGEAQFQHAVFQKVSFSNAKFCRYTNFRSVVFEKNVSFRKVCFGRNSDTDFSRTQFADEAKFNSCQFDGNVRFRRVVFEKKSHVKFFDIGHFAHKIDENCPLGDFSNVSFIGTDIIGIRFDDNAYWNKEKNRFKIKDEQEIENIIKKDKEREKGRTDFYKDITFEGLITEYRNLRENYETRRMYDEAGQFFIREMEIKRKYKDRSNDKNRLFQYLSTIKDKFKKSDIQDNNKVKIKEKEKFWQHISLINLYRILSNYGESIWRPVGLGLAILIASTFFLGLQSNPYQEQSLDLSIKSIINNTTYLDNLSLDNVSHKLNNSTQDNFLTHWQKAFTRTIGDFIPIDSSKPDEIKTGLLDYIIKIFGGILTFTLIGIALRRKLERKYTH